MAIINLYNADCMEFMRNVPDKHYDLAIVDPPYGIEEGNKTSHGSRKGTAKFTTYKKKEWDSERPTNEYWRELFRVSKNQIIWGGNYFTNFLPSKAKWIVWDKKQPEGIDQAMFELAWNSIENIQAKIYRQSAQSNCNKVANNRQAAKKYIRIHPTQKPVALYKWLLKNYAKQGDKILDTHAGSFSIGIACHEMGFDLDATEIDKDYYEAALKRYNAHISQQRLFNPNELAA